MRNCWLTDISQFAMETSWDGVTPTKEQWDSLGGHAFECLEDTKGAQSIISSRAILEPLHCIGQPQALTANLIKPRMAALIAGALTPHDGWATADLTNVRLASSSWDAADLSLLAFRLIGPTSSTILYSWGCPPSGGESA